MKFLACIQYDGSNYFGFQRLKKNRSVQQELENVLTKINKSSVEVKGAGRTDRGVHARNQMCHFNLDINITENGLKRAMNSLLPTDIYVNYVKIVNDDFHARFLVKRKIYTYKINVGEYDAINDKYLYNYGKELNIKLMKKAIKIIKGKHNFEAFVSGSRDNFNSEIYDIKIKKKKNIIFISFIGTSFYRYMVRNLVGALISVSEGKITLSELKNMIDTGEKKINYLTVPSNGLYLDSIEY